MAFDFDLDGRDPMDANPQYDYIHKTYSSPLTLPKEVYSHPLVEEWMAFIHDCHIPVELTLFEGNDVIKERFSDKPFVIYPLLLIESEILGFNGYIELESPDYIIEYSGGHSTGGFYIPDTSITIKQLLEHVLFKAGKTKTGTFADRHEMVKLLGATTNHEYHKKKGYMDSAERPLVTPEQIVGLFEKDSLNITNDWFKRLPKNIFQDSNVLVELKDKFLYINSGECAEPFKIDPMLMHLQSQSNPLILYVLTKELTERLMKEQLQREWIANMPNRLDSKPVLIFQVENKVIRGHHIFKYRDINREGEYRGLLRFIGSYEFDENDIFGRIILKKRNDGNRIEL